MSARQTGEPTAYDRRMLALMNREEARPFHATAGRRRAVVGAHLALSVLGGAAPFVAEATGRTWPLFVLLGLLVPWCLATGVLNSATRGLLELRGRVLDERQRAERDRVLARAHRLTTLVLLAAALGAVAAGGLGGFDGGPLGDGPLGDGPLGDGPLGGVRAGSLLLPALAGALLVHWLMPLWVAGLLVRDEPADEREA
ncbi:hypothetical protein [Streptomyces corynorhini]|uniref:Uncharacterized protein n=1 Tax=Streptomyces corynorhini TaxID=2282652 RepID=A0A370B568_9ACTN|nr:hypothetical protein [Streptomyces corynorhini]RDG35802.1 hypothetical protein DVH02_23350 [Streptomyces corynorhini]